MVSSWSLSASARLQPRARGLFGAAVTEMAVEDARSDLRERLELLARRGAQRGGGWGGGGGMCVEAEAAQSSAARAEYLRRFAQCDSLEEVAQYSWPCLSPQAQPKRALRGGSCDPTGPSSVLALWVCGLVARVIGGLVSGASGWLVGGFLGQCGIAEIC